MKLKLKMLGIVALLFSGIGAAFFVSREEDKKLLRTRAWIEFVMFVRSSVEGYSLPISKILESCDAEIIARLGYPNGELPPKSLSELVERVDIPDEESGEAVRGFLRDFGKNYREYQISRCDDCIGRLCEREKILANQLPSKKKVIFAVSLCATAAVVILLL